MRNTDTCVGVETIFGGKEKAVLAYRYFWRNRDTCVGVETLFGRKETPVSEKRYFWNKKRHH